MKPIENAAVVGSGTMGHGIALGCALGGKPVALIDVKQDFLRNAEQKIKSAVQTLVECGWLTAEKSASVLGNITYTDSLVEGAKSADIVIEAIPERFEMKEELFKNLDNICGPDTIYATNTSSLPVSPLAAICSRPDRVCGAHYFMPAHLIPLVEVVQGEQTSEETIQRVMAYMTAIGKHPVWVKTDLPGFIANRLQLAMGREALSLAQKGIASAEDIDNVAKKSFALRLLFTGPIEQRDVNGIDTHVNVTGYLYPHLEDTKEPVKILVDKAKAGDLGMKTGKGFYDWTDKDVSREMANKDKKLLALMQFLRTLDE